MGALLDALRRWIAHQSGLHNVRVGVLAGGREVEAVMHEPVVVTARVRLPVNEVRVLPSLDAVAQRAQTEAPYSHWYIDGGASATVPGHVVIVSYSALAAPRAALQARMQKTYEAAVFDPEAFRTMLAQIKPEEAGLASGGDPVLNRFQLSLLTEGSGTQVFSTTFVQWAAREVLRRAQPVTLFARFTPRQREKPMNELLAETQRRPELDPQGSLIDADMGAWYTWLNLQRLPEAEKAAFLVWFEDHEEALAISPGVGGGKQSDQPVELSDLIRTLA